MQFLSQLTVTFYSRHFRFFKCIISNNSFLWFHTQNETVFYLVELKKKNPEHIPIVEYTK